MTYGINTFEPCTSQRSLWNLAASMCFRLYLRLTSRKTVCKWFLPGFPQVSKVPTTHSLRRTDTDTGRHRCADKAIFKKSWHKYLWNMLNSILPLWSIIICLLVEIKSKHVFLANELVLSTAKQYVAQAITINSPRPHNMKVSSSKTSWPKSKPR